MNVVLNKKKISEIGDLLRKNAVKKAILYGPRALGTYKTGSEIDLTLEGSQLTSKELFNIEQEMEELLIPYRFNLSLYHQIENQELLDHIRRIGLVLYEESL